MPADTLPVRAPATLPAASSANPRAPKGFVISRRFDLACFLLPPLGTVAFLLGQRAFPTVAFTLCALVWVGLAQSHFGATLLFYSTRESRAHYRTAPLIYYGIPLVLVLGYPAIGLTAAAPIALALVPVASFWHGNRQSFGVCGLYRGLAGSFARSTRTLELFTIFAGGACFTSAGAVRLGMLPSAGTVWLLHPRVLTAWWVALAVASTLVIICVINAWREARHSAVPAWPRCWMIVASWGMYIPYVVATDPLSAFLASLIPHYMQYHGLMFLIHRNKVAAGATADDDLTVAVVKNPLTYISTTVGFALVVGALLLGTYSVGRVDVGLCLVAGINVAHFWLDGFFWRFRDPFMRQSTLRFLRPARS